MVKGSLIYYRKKSLSNNRTEVGKISFRITGYTIFMARPSKDTKKKWTKWQGKRDKETVIFGLNLLIQKEIGDHHIKSQLKDEQYIIKSNSFQEAISKARSSLGLIKGKRVGVYMADLEKAVKETLETTGLSNDWYSYVEEYIATNKQPERPFFIHPGKIKVIEINEKNELIIQLKPGLRYEDYKKAWKVFARPLGDGARLNKSYSNEAEHMQWLRDKDSGMTYLQVSTKHYPHNPEGNVEKIKKAILRLKKRQERDK